MFESRRSWAVGVMLSIWAAACSSDSESSDNGDGLPPPYSGAPMTSGTPSTPSSETPAPAPADPGPAPAANPTPAPVNEGNQDLPVAPPEQPAAGAGGSAGTGEQPAAGGSTMVGVAGSGEQPGPDLPPVGTARTRVFVLFGQSNMYGLPAPQQEDLVINPRVEVLTLQACGRHGAGQWMPAQPPLHGCVGQPSGSVFGPGVGPGDYFARAIAAAFPEDTILLVPNAIPGVSIDVFQPNQPDYNSMLARARMAQQRGEISGFIFHQGESDGCNAQSRASWPGRVKNVVDRLRADLDAPNAPFVAGELINLYDCSADMNPVIDSLPNTIANAAVVSSDGNFAAVQGDNYNNIHFELVGQRELGRRYGDAMLGLLQP